MDVWTEEGAIAFEELWVGQSSLKRSRHEEEEEESVCNSGGAQGADLCFGECAEKVGHAVRHYTFSGLGGYAGPHAVVLSPQELSKAMKYVQGAALMLKKNPPKEPTTTNLIARNWYQVKDVNTVYAIGRWRKEAGACNSVDGGTGWTVAMAIIMEVPNIYVFDLEENHWYQYNFRHGYWAKTHRPPTPSGRYAGIGTRSLSKFGRGVIQSLFDHD